MHSIDSSIIDALRSLFDSTGWSGVVLAMAIESACVPLPSEIIMPLAGWLLVAEHHRGWSGIMFSLLRFGAPLATLIGSTVAYVVGATPWPTRNRRYGRWILITRKDLDRADRWSPDCGARLRPSWPDLPVVRTFISLPPESRVCRTAASPPIPSPARFFGAFPLDLVRISPRAEMGGFPKSRPITGLPDRGAGPRRHRLVHLAPCS